MKLLFCFRAIDGVGMLRDAIMNRADATRDVSSTSLKPFTRQLKLMHLLKAVI